MATRPARAAAVRPPLIGLGRVFLCTRVLRCVGAAGRGERLLRCCARLPLYPSTPPRVKRTHAANQMKRVQRVEDSLAQSGARSPSVLPAESMARPI